jgi:hypothetical protein
MSLKRWRYTPAGPETRQSEAVSWLTIAIAAATFAWGHAPGWIWLFLAGMALISLAISAWARFERR